MCTVYILVYIFYLSIVQDVALLTVKNMSNAIYWHKLSIGLQYGLSLGV